MRTSIRPQRQARLEGGSCSEDRHPHGCSRNGFVTRVDLLGHPDWPVEQRTGRIEELRSQQEDAEKKLAEAENRPDLRGTNDMIATSTEVVLAPKRIYGSVAEADKKVLNQTCFAKLYVDWADDRQPIVRRREYGEAMKPLIEHLEQTDPGRRNADRKAVRATGMSRAKSCTKRRMVVDTGIEPVTPRV
jgi:hypothetical protein